MNASHFWFLTPKEPYTSEELWYGLKMLSLVGLLVAMIAVGA